MQKRQRIEKEIILKNIFGREPLDDLAWNLSIFLKKSIGACFEKKKNLENAEIEIEARLGIIKSKSKGERISDSASAECMWNFESDYFFDPNMSQDQHGQFNQMLNHIATCNPEIKYTHSKCTDTLYATGHRVTRDESNKLIACIKKVKVSELHIRSPNSGFDYRISVNLEVGVDVPKDINVMEPKYIRKKDRVSYRHQVLAIDLTQVNTKSNEKIHELEVEFKDISGLISQKNLADLQKANCFCKMVKVFLNTLRMLSRMGKVSPF